MNCFGRGENGLAHKGKRILWRIAQDWKGEFKLRRVILRRKNYGILSWGWNTSMFGIGKNPNDKLGNEVCNVFLHYGTAEGSTCKKGVSSWT